MNPFKCLEEIYQVKSESENKDCRKVFVRRIENL